MGLAMTQNYFVDIYDPFMIIKVITIHYLYEKYYIRWPLLLTLRCTKMDSKKKKKKKVY